MTRRILSAALLWALAPAALADVTPEEVWAHWQTTYARAGSTLTAASQARDGAVLRLENVTTVATRPNGQGIALSEWMELEALEDGRVGFTMAPEQQIVLHVKPGDEPPLTLPFGIRYDGFVATIGGTAERLETATTMDALRIEETWPWDGSTTYTLDIVLSDVVSGAVTDLGAGDGVASSGTMTATALDLDLSEADGNDARSETHVTMDAVDVDFRFAPAGATPEGAFVALPFTAELVLRSESARSNSAADEDSDDFMESRTSSGPQELTFNLDQQAMVVEFVSSENTTSLGFPVPGIAAPVRWTTARQGYALTLPLGRVGEPGPFRVATSIEGLMVDDAIWNLFDADRAIDRSPISYVFDLSGVLRWTTDLAAMIEDTPDTPPLMVDALTLDAFDIAAAGAALSTTGSASLDNSKPGLAPGMPDATGTLAMTATGIDALIGQLVAAGLIPQDQLMAVRLALAVFISPTGETDSYRSNIELPGDGTVVVNGQPYPLDGLK